MSFWAGVVQGVKDVDVLKEKEALADERQGVRDQENARYDESITYRNTRDAAADARFKRGDTLDAIKTLNINNLTGVSLGGPSSRTPSPSGGAAPGNLAFEVDRAYALGATDEDLASLMGHNQSPNAIAAVVDEYNSYVSSQDGKPGELVPFSDFTRDTTVTFSSAQEVTVEMIEAAAQSVGVNSNDIYQGNLTVGELISARLRQSAGNGQFSVTTPGTPDPMSVSEVLAATTAANGSIVTSLEQRLADLKVMYNDIERGSTEKQRISGLMVQAGEDLENYGKGVGREQFINEHGANAILSIMANSPDSVGRNDMLEFQIAVDNRTYNSEAEVLGAYRRNDLLDGDKYVIGNDIFSANGEALESASRGPESSLRPRARPDDLLGTKVGVLPTAPETVPKTDTLFPDFDPTPFTFDKREQANSYMGSLPPEERAKVPYIIIGGKIVKNSVYVSSDEAPAGLGGDEPVVEEVIPVVEGDTTAPSLPAYYEGYARMGEKMGADAVDENAALNPPVNVESEAPAEPVAVEAIPAGQDLNPDQSAELKAGVEELIAAILANEDQGKLEVISRGLNARFTQERVGEAIGGSMGSNESEVLEGGAAEEAEETGPTRIRYRNAVYDVYPDGRVVTAGGQFKGSEVPTDAPLYGILVEGALGFTGSAESTDQ